MFEVGDVVLCVDAIDVAGRVPCGLSAGARYVVTGLVRCPVDGAGVRLRGFGYDEVWRGHMAWRFVKVPPADLPVERCEGAAA